MTRCSAVLCVMCEGWFLDIDGYLMWTKDPVCCECYETSGYNFSKQFPLYTYKNGREYASPITDGVIYYQDAWDYDEEDRESILRTNMRTNIVKEELISYIGLKN